MLAMTETWLTPDVPDEELSIPHSNLYRRDILAAVASFLLAPLSGCHQSPAVDAKLEPYHQWTRDTPRSCCGSLPPGCPAVLPQHTIQSSSPSIFALASSWKLATSTAPPHVPAVLVHARRHMPGSPDLEQRSPTALQLSPPHSARLVPVQCSCWYPAKPATCSRLATGTTLGAKRPGRSLGAWGPPQRPTS